MRPREESINRPLKKSFSRHSIYRRRCQDKRVLCTRFSCIGRPYSNLLPTVDRSRRGGGDPTLADAILDRVVHNAHKIKLKGESVRKSKSKVD